MDVGFHGLSAFPLTPADEDGVVDAEALSRLIERLDAAEVDSIGLLGSTGSYAYLSRAERLRAIKATVESLKGKRPLIVGVGALRTSESVALAKDAEAAGADALLLAPVSYTPLTQEEAYHHFAAVAGSTSLPLCIYNNPSTTKFSFGDELLVRLAYIPHIRAVKMPLPADMAFKDELERLRPRLGEGFAIGYSGDWGASQAVMQGANCWYSVIGGLLPVPSLRLLRAAQAGDATEVERIEAYFQPLWSLFQEFGSYRVVYAAANLLSLTHRQPPLPVMPLSVSDCARVEEALAKLSELDGLPAATP
ncbi:dihydrodipicolinate synthase family protein [Agrobacterium rubi]|uniref:Dihydrodipicolinate synthase family protein n=1 Tax=Agrobacterium rubi TaxID=28099 RepID=A0AAE7URA6_9HYPH|nr:dihydrodipicolinate synthase family protein [Agrobacterium rubi]NTE85723.1 dihydrodipicolinate synthase family protein [Agrobacterium rubi]NTF01655.1 dihydrodipicolinate synthase family protein [Agrobacterium rubi]NTF35898.1 dihydrodipicolinate synthase family protein [Agrobacterium rubi]OCJ48219.1 dihydrodipicolinate synthase family protein [Agrobacterium rubi]QTG01001.1 dihydrodipicolinate synthase family protein [Agrobacterium rubi]